MEENQNTYELDIVAFKALDKAEKYNKVAEFVTMYGKLPSTNGKPINERTVGLFWTNAKAMAKRDNAKDWEITRIAEITAMIPSKNTRMDRIKSIITFCETNKKTPSQSSEDASERKLSQTLNALRIIAKAGNLTLEEAEQFTKISEYKSNYQKPREEKLTEILEFCKKNEHTPRQHTKDNVDEKRMAELLSTTKALASNNKLDKKCLTILNEIMKFAPMSRTEKLDELLKFVNKHKYAPKVNSNNSNERQLSAFMTKMKAFLKAGSLSADEVAVFNKIIATANVKSRIDKLNDLYEYTKSIGHHPKLNTDVEEERKFAMFFTNIKQCRKLGKLNESELAVLSNIEAYSNEPVVTEPVDIKTISTETVSA